MELVRLAGCAVLLAAVAWAQEQPHSDQTAALLQNTGQPMRVPFRCTEDDLQWGGMACSRDEPCPTYLELTAVESVGQRLFAVGDIHSETVTLYSILLASEDSGATWREAYQRIRGAGLDHLQFIDFSNGWASGEALSPLPQDAFLLITSDGGHTWRRQPLFSEGRPGLIQRFWFENKDEGILVIDRGQGSSQERYELYQSTNGGETWALQQASRQPIELRAGPASPALWRVRADGRTQAFVLEHQQTGRWGAAASFAVDAGPCPSPAPR